MKKIKEQKNKEVEKIKGIKVLEDIRFKDLRDKAEKDHQAEVERIKKVGK